jgi:hypothetical protein
MEIVDGNQTTIFNQQRAMLAPKRNLCQGVIARFLTQKSHDSTLGASQKTLRQPLTSSTLACVQARYARCCTQDNDNNAEELTKQKPAACLDSRKQNGACDGKNAPQL